MRIGIDARPLIKEELTGIGVYVKSILEVFVKEYPDNQYILYSYSPLKGFDCSASNVKVVLVKSRGRFATIGMNVSLSHYIKRDKLDVFWGTRHILPTKVAGVKYVLTIHDLALFINPNWRNWTSSILERINTRRSVKRADEFIAVSNSTKNDIIKFFKINEKRIHVTYLGRPQSCYEESIEAREIPSYLLYLGTIEPRKNIDNIVKAFELVSKKYPNIKLKIAGGLGWKYEAILDQIKQYHGPSSIEMLGFISQSEKTCLLKNSIAFLFPSHYEGFGIPILEALSAGTLVVSANNSSLPEVGGPNTYYVEDENNPGEIASKIEEIITLSDDERNNVIANNKEWALQFSWLKCANETINVIQNVNGEY